MTDISTEMKKIHDDSMDKIESMDDLILKGDVAGVEALLKQISGNTKKARALLD